MISKAALYARKARERKKQIQRLCDRLDRHILAAEKLGDGPARIRHLKLAAIARKELCAIDH